MESNAWNENIISRPVQRRVTASFPHNPCMRCEVYLWKDNLSRAAECHECAGAGHVVVPAMQHSIESPTSVTDAPLDMASGASIYPSLYIEVCKVLFSTKPFFCGVSPGLLHASSMSGRKRRLPGSCHICKGDGICRVRERYCMWA